MANTPPHADTLSKRGAENTHSPDHWAPLVKALASPWSPSNPDGMVILGLAENSLMHRELSEYIKKTFDINEAEHYTYGHGPKGSDRLLGALSSFFNDRFQPVQPTRPDQFLVTSGVSAVIDHLTWCLCDEGEGILFPQPLYTGFCNDIPTRSRGKIVLVPFEREDGTLDLGDLFDPETNLRCLEKAFLKSENEGVKVKAVMTTNPHNPLGKCYPVETIKAIAAFCAKHNIHYLSDEIYAMSVFKNSSNPDATTFHSVISVDLDAIIKPELVHVLYGAAKDFCANGLRLGTLYSRNEALRKAMTMISAFGWVPYMVQDMWAKILEDHTFLNYYISENQQRLAKHYNILTTFLSDQQIPYVEGGNAAVFVWVDLRKWLLGDKISDLKVLRKASPEYQTYFAKETLLNETWQKKGVWIGKASAFNSEELGWFRIVFTAAEEPLRIGMQRFVDVLEELHLSGELSGLQVA